MASSYGQINHGQVAVTGTAKAITADATIAGGGATDDIGAVAVRANAANANPVFVGGSSVSLTNGYQLSAGSAVVLNVSTAALVFVIGTAGSDVVSWVAVSPA